MTDERKRKQKFEKMMFTLENTLILLILIVFNVDCRQSFDREPEERHVNPGDDAIMHCQILDKHRNSQCIWQKDGKPIRIQVEISLSIIKKIL